MEYRAAYLTDETGFGTLVLTLPEHAGLSDEELMAEAMAEAKRAGIANEIDADRVKIGTWRE